MKNKLKCFRIAAIVYLTLIFMVQVSRLFIPFSSYFAFAWKTGFGINLRMYGFVAAAFSESVLVGVLGIFLYFGIDILMIITYVKVWKRKRRWYIVMIILMSADLIFTVCFCRHVLFNLVTWILSILYKIAGCVIFFQLYRYSEMQGVKQEESADMLMFSELFLEADSNEIEYKGKKVNSDYLYDLKGSHRLKFSIIKTASIYKQAVVLHLFDFKGKIFMDGQRIKIEKRKFPQLVFTEQSTPKQFELEVFLEEGQIAICNGFVHQEFPNEMEVVDSMIEGCAMMIEKKDAHCLRFYCNDCECDDDFDDLIFELEII